MSNTTSAARLIRLEAKPGTRTIAECFRSALTMTQAESAAKVWFEVRLGCSTLALPMRFRIKQVGRHTFRPALPIQCWRKVLNPSPSHPPWRRSTCLHRSYMDKHYVNHCCGRRSLRPGTNRDRTAFSAIPGGTLQPSAPDGDGTADPLTHPPTRERALGALL